MAPHTLRSFPRTREPSPFAKCLRDGPRFCPTAAHIFAARRTAAMFGVGTALHSLAPKGRGWGEGVTMIQNRTAGAPSSHLLPHGEKE
jgi:hypothetical protein